MVPQCFEFSRECKLYFGIQTGPERSRFRCSIREATVLRPAKKSNACQKSMSAACHITATILERNYKIENGIKKLMIFTHEKRKNSSVSKGKLYGFCTCFQSCAVSIVLYRIVFIQRIPYGSLGAELLYCIWTLQGKIDKRKNMKDKTEREGEALYRGNKLKRYLFLHQQVYMYMYAL